MIKFMIYKLRPTSRQFGISLSILNRILEVSLWYYNVFIFWGKDE